MGQGSDSCGGYEVDYDPYEEGMEAGEWTTKGGGSIHITKMSLQHLRNARSLAFRAQMSANFTDTADKWEQWVDMFDSEISSREVIHSHTKKMGPKAPPQLPRGKMVDMICHCKKEYKARQADLNRDQGFSCCKRCAAIRREFGRPAAKRKPQ